MLDEEDVTFVQRCLKGDNKAFEILIDRYEKPVYNVALRISKNVEDAADLTQAVFVKAYEQLSRYDSSFRFFSWLYRIAINESLNFVGRRKDQQELGTDLATDLPYPDEIVNQQEQNSMLHTAIDSLKTDYRIVITLFHFLDLSYREIGEILDIPEKTVKSRLFTARTLLRSELTREGYLHG